MIVWMLVGLAALISIGAIWDDVMLRRRLKATRPTLTQRALVASTPPKAPEVEAIEAELPGYGITPQQTGVTVSAQDMERLLNILVEAQYARDALHMLTVEFSEEELQKKDTIVELRQLCRKHRYSAHDKVQELVKVLDVWIDEEVSNA